MRHFWLNTVHLPVLKLIVLGLISILVVPTKNVCAMIAGLELSRPNIPVMYLPVK